VLRTEVKEKKKSGDREKKSRWESGQVRKWESEQVRKWESGRVRRNRIQESESRSQKKERSDSDFILNSDSCLLNS
jgi:hypothetical protein